MKQETKATAGGPRVSCRRIRSRLRTADRSAAGWPSVAEVNIHLEACSRCAKRARLLALQRRVLNATAAAEDARPDEDWLRGLMLRIEREGARGRLPNDSPWSMILSVTAKQMIPAMALLVLLITALSLWIGRGPAQAEPMTPTAFLLSNRRYQYPQAAPDDEIGGLLAVRGNNNEKHK